MISRNSRIYKLMSKLINPVTKRLQSINEFDPETTTAPVSLDSAGLKTDWKWYQKELISSTFTESGLVMTCTRESVWYQNLRGPMLYRYIGGDGTVSLTVKTRKSSDTANFPDTQWQFGGVMFRDPSSDSLLSRENYVFNVVGYRHDALQIETKSTRNGYSDVSAFDWDTGDAELLIERRGPVFTLKAKPVDASEWQEMCQFVRPDFPAIMQLGIIVYAYSEGREIVDLQAEFSTFKWLEA